MIFTLDMRDDSPPPGPGDLLFPRPPRRAHYQVDAVCPVDSRQNPHRWRLTVHRVYPQRPDGETRIDAGSHGTWWYS